MFTDSDKWTAQTRPTCARTTHAVAERSVSTARGYRQCRTADRDSQSRPFISEVAIKMIARRSGPLRHAEGAQRHSWGHGDRTAITLDYRRYSPMAHQLTGSGLLVDHSAVQDHWSVRLWAGTTTLCRACRPDRRADGKGAGRPPPRPHQGTTAETADSGGHAFRPRFFLATAIPWSACVWRLRLASY